MTPIITLQQLTFQAQQLLHYPDVQIAAKQVTFLQGASGSGKSTLLRLINATESPTSGQILYQAKNIAQWDTLELRRQVLLLNQRLFLFPQTIRQNFQHFYDYLDKPLPDNAQMSDFLCLCHADFGLDTQCGVLSGGEQQRVFLAIALSLQPKVLMLDEPTSALDNQLAETVLSAVLNYCRQQQITVLAISHDQQLVQRHADAIVAISKE
ncbi:ATP-binding cassette domain-containing protein [Testudinibacter sp. TR-2022]|uniref:ABC transporter ATP-binding protein n=1 Tax=Testudinibacter sp. TR-2022 TaxID=2585029 RepID=UPI00111B84BB|nr:ATP-binding cassette domain-containing protein [Testudinibacter sp. TR-2022]TNH04074.1 ATP-binding cassette domain-containing protein [Pasteurellaceae bacterium Phil31]TNH09755.1 ATP-binding cassette domain-containing protein [Testudinibacter sp. TR-2022]TNH10982.1 ATP-binding cassette domain-containing protein [Testudinibacter sp. TR-2022]TNH14743.1 ATP-binding cassette domain-containing protein [Testudinibacter sp. TR-2022]TNH20560.1 ATP-binding cassette domain-containing protein [Testudi